MQVSLIISSEGNYNFNLNDSNMPLNSDELELITCKSTKDFHIVEDPILLPCSFSVCRKCYESIKFCVICKKEHLIAVDEIYSNESVNQLIKENIKDFKLTIALKVEKELTGFEGKNLFEFLKNLFVNMIIRN